MTEKEIESRLRRAFENAAPNDFPKALSEQCSEREERSVDIKEQNNKARRLLKVLLIAAVLVIALTVTVTAISLSNLIDPTLATHRAMEYVIVTQTDPVLKEQLSNALISGLVYDENIGTGEAEIGLKNGRIVYNISFKTCGYTYNVMMDAKTGVVYSLDRATDENWNEMLPYVREEADRQLAAMKNEQKRQEEERLREIEEAPDYCLLESRFDEHFGISLSSYSANFKAEPDAASHTAVCTVPFDGYIYTATLDYSGNIIDENIAEDPDFKGERVRHEKIDGIISLDDADELAEEAIAEKYPDTANGLLVNTNITCITKDAEKDGYNIVLNFRYYSSPDSEAKNFKEDFVIHVWLCAEDGAVEAVKREYGLEAIREKALEYIGLDKEVINMLSANGNGECVFESEMLGRGVKLTVNPESLELISIEEYEVVKASEDYDLPNALLSGDAQNGYISEAAAATVALENSGVNNSSVFGLTCELSNDIYKITFKFGISDYPKSRSLRTNTYEIDAKTGKILGFDAITADDFISEEEAVERVKILAAEENGAAEEFTITDISLKDSSKGYYFYEIKMKKEGGTRIFMFQIDAISGNNLTNG